MELPKDQDKFSAGVRMVERKLIIKFLQVLPLNVKSLTQIRGYYITESKLLSDTPTVLLPSARRPLPPRTSWLD